MKQLVHATIALALASGCTIDDILRQLIVDLNAQPQSQPQARADRRAVRLARTAAN